MSKHKEQAIHCQEELNSCLLRLVQHFEYDFTLVSVGLQKYYNFLKVLYPATLAAIDASYFTPAVCRARYCMLDSRSKPKEKSPAKVVPPQSQDIQPFQPSKEEVLF